MRVLLVVVMAFVPPAFADTGWRPTLGAEGHVGNGPFGAGVAATFEPGPWLAVSAGLGKLDDRLRGGAIARLRLWNPKTIPRWPTLSLGSGVWVSNQSTYPDHPFGESPYSYATWDRVWWLDFHVALEQRWRGVQARAYVGLGGAMASSGYHCDNLRGDPSCPSAPLQPPPYLYAGLSLGYAFSL